MLSAISYSHGLGPTLQTNTCVSYVAEVHDSDIPYLSWISLFLIITIYFSSSKRTLSTFDRRFDRAQSHDFVSNVILSLST